MTRPVEGELLTWDRKSGVGTVWVRRSASRCVAEFDSGEQVEIPTSCDLLLASFLERDRVVVVAQRAKRDTANARIISRSGIERTFYAGDAIQDLVALGNGTIVTSYFDEGSTQPISDEGLVAFDRDGNIVRGYRSTTGESIADCYAAVAFNDDSVAVWHYPDWNLTIWNVATGRATHLRPPGLVRGAHAITNRGDDWWFHSPYTKPGRIFHWRNGDSRVNVAGKAEGHYRGRIGGELQSRSSDSTRLVHFEEAPELSLKFDSADDLAEATLAALREANVDLGPGLSQSEIALAEERVGCTFPDDLRLVLTAGLPTGDRFPTWRDLGSEALEDQLVWPVDGIIFDVEQSDFWYPNWPERPKNMDHAKALARSLLATVPALIPLAGHRYLPSQPGQFGNPVLSAYQTDIIIYGMNLAEYVENEFLHHQWRVGGPTTPLPFWGYFLEADF